ncbi:MAG: hypothetical protein DRO92_00135, partial [Candidatus Altiarchaeales archaeon]
MSFFSSKSYSDDFLIGILFQKYKIQYLNNLSIRTVIFTKYLPTTVTRITTERSTAPVVCVTEYRRVTIVRIKLNSVIIWRWFPVPINFIPKCIIDKTSRVIITTPNTLYY